MSWLDFAGGQSGYTGFEPLQADPDIINQITPEIPATEEPFSNYTYGLDTSWNSIPSYAGNFNTDTTQTETPAFVPAQTAAIQGTQDQTTVANEAPTSFPSTLMDKAGDAAKYVKTSILGDGTGKSNANFYKTALGLGGVLSNLAGNLMQSKATKTGQSDYLNAVTWTPEKQTNYMNALKNNVTSVYGNLAQKSNKAMSKSNAVKGRGGGTYGQEVQENKIAMNNAIASALNTGQQTVSTPPQNLSYNAFTNTDPYASTLTGMGSLAGGLLNTQMSLEQLKALKDLGIM